MQTRPSVRSAFTLVEIMIVVAIIGLLAAIAIPNFARAREDARRVACVANLKSIAGAKATWSLEHRRGNGDVPADADLFGSAMYIAAKPACPANGAYTLNQVDAHPTCSVPNHTL
jgi:prepilin-type N-terminal cleavage/methylation domain-containing protein